MIIISIKHFTLERELELLVRRAEEGLAEAGEIIQEAARANLDPYAYNYTASDQTTVSKVSRIGETSEITVGVHDLGLAPHARALEFGWKSATGKQPPTEPIAEWLEVKLGVDPQKSPGIAFVIARRIGHGDATRPGGGFSFGALHWLQRAADDNADLVGSTIADAAKE